MKKKYTSTRLRKAPLEDMTAAVQDFGLRLYPSAQRYLWTSLQKAQDKHLIRTADDMYTCKIALLSAGIEEARKEHADAVRVRHVQEGWRRRLSVGPGNCPPYRCARRSILERLDEVEANIPAYRELLAKLED